MDNTTGVLELVKNGYDADADNVRIELSDLGSPEKTSIVIQDDGVGMNEDTIRGPWSEPAHGGKEHEKTNMIRTPKGRLPLGEKGVGRFATQKLGRSLDMTTRPKGGQYEYHVRIDWKDFDRGDAYLDEIPFRLERREPLTFTGDLHGTRLVITGANTPWKRGNVEKMQARLMRLLSPTRDMHGFSVSLTCPDYPELQSLETADVLEKYQFRIDCHIDASGMAEYEYRYRKHDGNVSTRTSKVNVWSQVSKNWERTNPTCGPIRVVISAWIREAGKLKEYGLTREKLSGLCGVSIYRDGFRIIPYGDEGDDWLNLERRRTNQPGKTYSNSQVIGQVEIEQDKNGGLVDKTSREGLQENQAFFDMKDLTFGVVRLLVMESAEVRDAIKTPRQATTRKMETELTALKSDVGEIREYVTGKPDKDVPSLQERDNEYDDGEGDEPTSVKPVDAVVEKLDSIDATIKNMTRTTDEIKEQNDAGDREHDEFIHLAGVGMVAERFCHEFDRLVGGMNTYVRELEEKHPQYRQVKNLRRALDSLRNEVSLLDNARYVRKAPEEEMLNVRETVMQCVESHRDQIAFNEIQVETEDDGSDFYARMSTASLTQAVDNIITNTIHWLGEKTEKGDRRMHILLDAADRCVVISNNGTPVPQAVMRRIHNRDKFVTTKPDGRGLGMYITSEVLSRYKTAVACLEGGDPKNKYGAAAFMIRFGDAANPE